MIMLFFAKELKSVTNLLEYVVYSTYYGIVLLLYVNKFYRRQIVLTLPNRKMCFLSSQAIIPKVFAM